MKIRKWTFINVLFSKIQNRFEKTLHHSFSQRLRSISPKSQYIYTSFYTSFYKGFFLFYNSKTSKPHASQSYSSGAMRTYGRGGIDNILEFVTIMVTNV